MYRPPDIDNVEDFIAYYNRSWIGVPSAEDKTKIAPFLVGGAVNGKTTILGHYALPDGGIKGDVTIPFSDLLLNGQFGYPALGMVNVGPTVVYTWRGTPRTTAHGFRGIGIDRKTHVYGEWLLNMKGTALTGNDYQTALWSIFNPKTYTLKEAVSLLTAGNRVGQLIDNHWAVVLDHNYPTPLLVYKRETVGALDEKSESLYVFSEVQELWGPAHERFGLKILSN